MILIDGKKTASEIKEDLKLKIAKLKKETGKTPGLITILVGDNPASQTYVNSKHKDCEEVGIYAKNERLPAGITEAELLKIIEKYNADDNFHGILTQLPLPKHINEDRIIEAISPQKDVDGFHPINAGNLVIGKDCLMPCTPAGIWELIKRYNIETEGKHVVVVGRSNIVGKPIANIMVQKKKGANSVVTACHSAAKDLSYYTKQADILIAAIGRANFIKGDMIKENCVIIDVGINHIEDKNSPKGYKIVGDVDFESVVSKASHITPVPGGVGLMTRAMLLANTCKAFMNLIGITE
ncbi:MAG TPA: bifunctional 5,10-methylenetetrahydrofolate dehydrogenase/5,10-methenyltetrahydrofolate cyclohydrolase [Ignavibacteriales bacterium]|nr:bifunctional 5,10-methylenetetrahydrofolate dehydrogenase/5,10-methenyltetrahydrofolate cyclohydrolase [Ignavibacteriales bacterium]